MRIYYYLQEFNTASIFLRLLLSIVLGGLLGLDRVKKHQAAGIRTFSLVCLGSALVILTNEFIYYKSGGGDTSRMAAQVISGIGFLGAGTIIVTANNRIRGLTTAACLWLSAVLGLAIGSGLYIVSIFCFALALLIMKILQYYHDWYDSREPLMELYLEIDPENGVSALRTFAKEKFFTIKTIHRKKEKPLLRNDLCVSVELDLNGHVAHKEVVENLKNVKEIHYMEEI